MRVSEVMSPRIASVGPDLSIRETAHEMQSRGLICMPVCEHDQLIGVVTEHDITGQCAAKGHNPAQTKVRDVMSKHAACCFEDQDVTEAVRIMEQEQLYQLPVLDRQVHVVGMLSLGDLVSRSSRGLSGEMRGIVSEPQHTWITEYLSYYGMR